MEKNKLLALTVAGFCAAGMLGTNAQAKGKKAKKKTAEVAASVHCAGVNECKGKSECSTAENSCSGQNGCKGKGWVTKASADECTQAGGTVAQK